MMAGMIHGMHGRDNITTIGSISDILKRVGPSERGPSSHYRSREGGVLLTCFARGASFNFLLLISISLEATSYIFKNH